MTILLLFAHNMWGQNNNGQYKYFVPSPQTNDFMKFGNQPVNYYTGGLDMKIPLYSYKDNDFNIDISLGYNSSGFVPNKQPTVVGLNWFMNVGGCITRKIRGVPDDKLVTAASHQVCGLYNGWKRYSFNYSNSDIFNFNQGHGGIDAIWYLNNTNPYVETESDIYTFSFMGNTGKFVIDFNGKANVYGSNSPKTYDVNLNGLNNQSEGQIYPSSSEIVITKGDGYVYKFGGDSKYLEYLTGDITSDIESKFYNATIVSWYLKEVIAPNGRKITFEYYPFSPQYYAAQFRPMDTKHYLLNIYPKSFAEMTEAYNSYGTWFGSVYNSVIGGYNSQDNTYEAQKIVYLKSILVDNDSLMSFRYSEREKKFYQETFSTPINYFNQKNLQLNSIQIFSQPLVKRVFFSYNYLGNTGKERMFLNNVLVEGQGRYSFEYYSGNFPSPTTRGIDYWGFWNGNDSQNDLIPNFSIGQNGDITYLSTNREAATTDGIYNIGLLSKVIYPTNGYTSIEYEPHKYNRLLDRRSDGNFLPLIYNGTEKYAGGARVKKIIDSDGSQIINTRDIYYTQSYDPQNPGSGTSSAVLLNWPRFVYAIQGDYFPGSGQRNIVQLNSIGISVGSLDNEYITYSKAIEKQRDGRYTEFEYSNYITNPDNFTQVQRGNIISQGNYTINPYNFYQNIYREPNDKSYERGKLIRQKNYSSNGGLAAYKSFSYQSNGDEQFVPSIITSGDQFFSVKKYIHSYLLRTDTLNEYTVTNDGAYSGSQVQKIKSYNYNIYDQISSMKTNASYGSGIETKTIYSSDINDGIYILMKQKNILDLPIEKTTISNNYICSSKLITYKQNGSSFVPEKIYNLELLTPLHTSWNDFNYYNGITKDSHYGSLEEVNYQNYDSNNNLTKYVTKNGITTYILWGYKKRYPVAVIESSNNGYDLASIQTNINNHPFTTVARDEISYLRNQLTSYINNTSCLVKLYTYSPLTGQTSFTDPTGVTTYYVYNMIGQLWYAEDDDNHVIKKYEYNYINK